MLIWISLLPFAQWCPIMKVLPAAGIQTAFVAGTDRLTEKDKNNGIQ